MITMSWKNRSLRSLLLSSNLSFGMTTSKILRPFSRDSAHFPPGTCRPSPGGQEQRKQILQGRKLWESHWSVHKSNRNLPRWQEIRSSHILPKQSSSSRTTGMSPLLWYANEVTLTYFRVFQQGRRYHVHEYTIVFPCQMGSWDSGLFNGIWHACICLESSYSHQEGHITRICVPLILAASLF